MFNQFVMPSSLAVNQDEFRAMFFIEKDKRQHKLVVKTPNSKSWFEVVKGFAYAHILLYELDELTLTTPGMSSPDIDELRTDLAEAIAYYLQIKCKKLPNPEAKKDYLKPQAGFIYCLEIPSPIDDNSVEVVRKYWDGSQYLDFEGTVIDLAYTLIHELYIPTPEEYECIYNEEFNDKDASDTPIVQNRYDSIVPGAMIGNEQITELDNARFHFMLNKWNEWHDSEDEVDDSKNKLSMDEVYDSIDKEWNALPPQEQLKYARG